MSLIILTTAALFFGLSILYVAFSFFIKPLMNIAFYQKQNCHMRFFPLIGTFKRCLDSFASQGDFFGYFKNEIQKNPHLKVIGGNIVDKAQLFLVDPILIKEFFARQDNYFKAPFIAEMNKVIVGDSLVTTEGDVWKGRRKIIGTGFHYELLREMIPEVIKIADEIFSKQKDLDNVNVMHMFETITGNVVGKLFFGAEFSQYTIRGMPVTLFLSDLVGRIGAEISSPSYLILGARGIRLRLLKKYAVMMDDIKEIQDFARTIIEKRQAERANRALHGDTKKAFIDILLNSDGVARQETFSTEDAINEFITFFAGGMDTTGHLLGMAAYYLSQNPSHKARLMDEVNQYFEDPSKVDLEVLGKMDYMTAFMRETLRMAPPAPMITDRVAKADHYLGSLKIKKGTCINVGMMANNFNPAYHADPDAFSPERWLEGAKTREAFAKSPYIFVPFSAGSRNCIGQHLAMNEARAIFGLFLKKFDFILTPNYNHKMTVRLLYEPVEKLNFKLVPKEC